MSPEQEPSGFPPNLAEKLEAWQPHMLHGDFESQQGKRGLPDHLKNVQVSTLVSPNRDRWLRLQAQHRGPTVSVSDIQREAIEWYAYLKEEHITNPEMIGISDAIKAKAIALEARIQRDAVKELEETVKDGHTSTHTLKSLRPIVVNQSIHNPDPSIRLEYQDLLNQIDRRLM